MSLSWSDGTLAERSPRPQKHYQETAQVPKEIIDNNAYLQSLHGFEFRETNKREESYNKMAERELVAQIGQNPFLEKGANYIDDVSVRDQFLKPIATNTTDKSLQPNN